MAKKKETKKEVKLERVYNVPLRHGYMKAPMYKRAKKAVATLREFLVKHMKSEKVRIGPYLNKRIWQHGIKNPPHHVKINATKDSEGVVFAEIVGAPAPKPKKEKGRKEAKAEGKKEEKPAEKKEAKENTKDDKKASEDVKAALEGKQAKETKPAPKKEVAKKPAPKLSKEESEVKSALKE